MSDYYLGPCQITFKGADLGFTEGGVTLTTNMSSVVLHADQVGETPVDEYQTGVVMSVKGKLAKITLANIAALLNTTVTTDGTKQKVTINSGVGVSLPDQGGVMILKPYLAGVVDTNANRWVTLLKAGMKAVLSMVYDAKTQQVLDFEATGYVDSVNNIAVFGDETAT
jgi:hypothetical protein